MKKKRQNDLQKLTTRADDKQMPTELKFWFSS